MSRFNNTRIGHTYFRRRSDVGHRYWDEDLRDPWEKQDDWNPQHHIRVGPTEALCPLGQSWLEAPGAVGLTPPIKESVSPGTRDGCR